MFRKILIANRGEIVLRIARTCKEMGIIPVSVFSDADKNAYHTIWTDESVHIGGSKSSESYLRMEKIISAAKEAGAEAIHPGYGFLSENADFIQMVEESGLVFIGPSSKSVRMMGSKTAARELMSKSGVPIVPGTKKGIESVEEAKNEALKIGYPILFKASAGGGGKGLKRVNNEDELADILESAKREAKNAFGDDTVYIEKLIEEPRHIEVQVISDKHGNYAHLFERECSVQRRHQKIVEESPSTFIDQKTRANLTSAAVSAAKACGYVNAGTIEFLVDKNKNFYFLEMNTRLQVEHPVTEWITGIDLVKEQIRIAAGEKLSFAQDELKINGHAIECRIYAEDPANNFLPSTGVINYHKMPQGPGIRVDEGIDTGSNVSVYYDPMLSKLSCWSRNREGSIAKIRTALQNYIISGVRTNISLLIWVLNHSAFNSGMYDINFIEKEYLKYSLTEETSQPGEIHKIIAALSREAAKLPINGKNGKIQNEWELLKYD